MKILTGERQNRQQSGHQIGSAVEQQFIVVRPKWTLVFGAGAGPAPSGLNGSRQAALEMPRPRSRRSERPQT